MRLSALLLAIWLTVSAAVGQSFVQRNGTHLTLDGTPFRYSGPNIEWLGLEGYGPHDPMGPRLPSHFEIDDAFATAAEMGGRVVRAQTIGDTVGCNLCIEPGLDQFNEAAFAASDYALMVAGQKHMRLIVPLVGDCATCAGGGMGQYLAWNGKGNPLDFFSDPVVIASYERHIDAVLNHRNALTGLRYRDDPTIMAWENCNMCGIIATFFGGDDSLAQVAAWSNRIGTHIKSVDHNHLYLDTSGIFRKYPKALDTPASDLVTFEFYPHWDHLLSPGGPPTTAEIFTRDAADITAHGKVFIVNEFGWDKTDWKTTEELQGVLDVLAHDANVSGDTFWALQAHLDNFGFQPIPADSSNAAFAGTGESGEWWALYYPGMKTSVMSAEDMAARAQQLRTHAYTMAGLPTPRHAIPPAPIVTSTVLGGLVAWRGSAGAVRYSVERFDPANHTWNTVCDKCATDADDPWIDSSAAPLGSTYRVIAWNADGVRSKPN